MECDAITLNSGSHFRMHMTSVPDTKLLQCAVPTLGDKVCGTKARKDQMMSQGSFMSSGIQVSRFERVEGRVFSVPTLTITRLGKCNTVEGKYTFESCELLLLRVAHVRQMTRFQLKILNKVIDSDLAIV